METERGNCALLREVSVDDGQRGPWPLLRDLRGLIGVTVGANMIAVRADRASG